VPQDAPNRFPALSSWWKRSILAFAATVALLSVGAIACGGNAGEDEAVEATPRASVSGKRSPSQSPRASAMATSGPDQSLPQHPFR
jgi:hypothetical protein